VNNKATSQDSTCDKYIHELLAEISDPVHRQLIQAYRGTDPVRSMESELAEILMEALHRED